MHDSWGDLTSSKQRIFKTWYSLHTSLTPDISIRGRSSADTQYASRLTNVPNNSW